MNVKQFFSPIKIAVFLTVLLIFWLAFGEHRRARDQAPAEQQKTAANLTQVEVRLSHANLHDRDIVVQGQLEAWQEVAITAQVSGRVEKILKPQGEQVKTGDTLLVISDEGRSERLKQAIANVKLRERELANARSLNRSEFVAETEITRFESSLAEAKADLVERQLALSHSAPTAPFDGMVNRRYVDPGEWVTMGAALMDLVQVHKLRVSAFVPQQQVGELKVGQTAEIELLGGRSLPAELSFVSYAADAQTRSYRVEAIVHNPQHLRIAGASATLRIALPQASAHRFSPALLSLDSRGHLGVQVVNAEQMVEFHPVNTLHVDTESATVTGLPQTITLITRGAGFVKPGQRVKTVEAQ